MPKKIIPEMFSTLGDMVNYMVENSGDCVLEASKNYNVNYWMLRAVLNRDKPYTRYMDLPKKFERRLGLPAGSLEHTLKKPIDIKVIENSKTLGESLKYCRLSLNIDSGEVARNLNIKKAEVSHYETSIRKPGRERLDKIARLYGLNPELFYRFYYDEVDYGKLNSMKHANEMLRHIKEVNKLTIPEMAEVIGISFRTMARLLSMEKVRDWNRLFVPGYLEFKLGLEQEVFSRFFKKPEDVKHRNFRTFGKALKYYRKSLDIPKSDLARRLGIARQSIECYENDAYLPRILGSKNFQMALGLEKDVFAKYF